MESSKTTFSKAVFRVESADDRERVVDVLDAADVAVGHVAHPATLGVAAIARVQ